MKPEENKMEKIVSLCKRRGFIYPGSLIYGGLAGTFDYGPLGVTLKKNIENIWWKMFVENREDIYGIDAAILMNEKVWQASGHVDGFSDPLVEDLKTHRRFRADHLLEEAGVDIKGMSFDDMSKVILEKDLKSPDGNKLGPVVNFKMMFETRIGADAEGGQVSYLRPETAGGIFVNYKNVYDSFHPKLPFGIAQIGKAFRNEIAPRDFIFRVRELEQMEIEYFIDPKNWELEFENWRKSIWEFADAVGLPRENVHELEIPDADRAFYSKRTIDFEFDFPFGKKELYGLAYRTDYDLGRHSKASGEKMEYLNEETGERFLPHVIEPSLGVGRTMLAILSSAYSEDTVEGETRVFLKLSPAVAPVKVAVFPLLKNKPELVTKAREIFVALRKEISGVVYDESGSVGKRYRRQDEIGTPYCITVDFDTIEKDNTVTLRDRDTATQERINVDELVKVLKNKIVLN